MDRYSGDQRRDRPRFEQSNYDNHSSYNPHRPNDSENPPYNPWQPGPGPRPRDWDRNNQQGPGWGQGPNQHPPRHEPPRPPPPHYNQPQQHPSQEQPQQHQYQQYQNQQYQNQPRQPPREPKRYIEFNPIMESEYQDFLEQLVESTRCCNRTEARIDDLMKVKKEMLGPVFEDFCNNLQKMDAYHSDAQTTYFLYKNQVQTFYCITNNIMHFGRHGFVPFFQINRDLENRQVPVVLRKAAQREYMGQLEGLLADARIVIHNTWEAYQKEKESQMPRTSKSYEGAVIIEEIDEDFKVVEKSKQPHSSSVFVAADGVAELRQEMLEIQLKMDRILKILQKPQNVVVAAQTEDPADTKVQAELKSHNKERGANETRSEYGRGRRVQENHNEKSRDHYQSPIGSSRSRNRNWSPEPIHHNGEPRNEYGSYESGRNESGAHGNWSPERNPHNGKPRMDYVSYDSGRNGSGGNRNWSPELNRHSGEPRKEYGSYDDWKNESRRHSNWSPERNRHNREPRNEYGSYDSGRNGSGGHGNWSQERNRHDGEPRNGYGSYDSGRDGSGGRYEKDDFHNRQRQSGLDRSRHSEVSSRDNLQFFYGLDEDDMTNGQPPPSNIGSAESRNQQTFRQEDSKSSKQEMSDASNREN